MAPGSDDHANHSERDLLLKIVASTAATRATVEAINQRMSRDDETTRDHERRLRKLERLRWVAYGALTAALGSGADIAHRFLLSWRK